MDTQRDIDRRKYPRLNLPVFCRTARPDELRQKVIDASLGGIRVYSDDRHGLAERLELELFLPDGSSCSCSAKVVWCRTMAPEHEAKYELGMKFLELSGKASSALESFTLNEA